MKKIIIVIIIITSNINLFSQNNFKNQAFEIGIESIDSFREHGEHRGTKQKKGMREKAKKGKIMTRAAMGYSIRDGRLVPNEGSAKIHALFKEFLGKDDTLGSVAKKYSLSINGLKKILKNRTYLGEIKFDRQFHKGNHTGIISGEIFYAVQRKLDKKLRPREKKNKEAKQKSNNTKEEKYSKDASIESETKFMELVKEEPDEMYDGVFD